MYVLILSKGFPGQEPVENRGHGIIQGFMVQAIIDFDDW